MKTTYLRFFSLFIFLALPWGLLTGCSDGGGGSSDSFTAQEIQEVNASVTAVPDAMRSVAQSLVTTSSAALMSSAALTTGDQSLTCLSGTGNLHIEYDLVSATCGTGDIHTLTGTAITTFINCERTACETTATQDGTNSGGFVLTFDECTNTGTFVGTNIMTGSGCSDTSTMTARIGSGAAFPIGYNMNITLSIVGGVFTVDSVTGSVCTATGPCSVAGGCPFTSFDNLFATIDPADTCLATSSTATTCQEYYLDPATQTNPDPIIDAQNKDFCLYQGIKTEGSCCVSSSQCSGTPGAQCCPWNGDSSSCNGRESCECYVP